MLDPDQFRIQVSKAAPSAAAEEGDWRRADVVICGQIVASGFALARHGDQERAVRSEAVTIAKHNFDQMVEVRDA